MISLTFKAISELDDFCLVNATTVSDIVNSAMDTWDDTPTQVPTGFPDNDGKKDLRDFNCLHTNPPDLF